MKGLVSDCIVKRPKTLSEALAVLAAEPLAWTVLAGGTDLMVRFNAGQLRDHRFLDISVLKELKTLREDDAFLHVGALCTFSTLKEWVPVERFFPSIVASARHTGSVAIQNRGTLGGNIANASPAADTPPSLLAYGAELELCSVRGTRIVPYDAFHLEYKKMDLAEDELISAVRLPKPAGKGFHFFRKVGTRKAQAISKLCLAAYAQLENGGIADIRIGLGSLGPVPRRARGVESVLRHARLDSLPWKAAREALEQDISPIDDIRSTAHYRRVAAGNILAQMLKLLLE